ncbi:FadR/GntR family transcriptional regulator [Kaistia nematophila]|uniref:FadR/GntR family transcriptional regulator n=1 Tax=Kaistia nematophila TaxID=2994654 RepID=A0A9X3ILY3_9HYPH|nr:FadR/GntR family transcriptional regulator [Kaistia nematophila]MBN9027930.1 FadR family transcriptional regulator [Hyphomicrobiales bacterium]MCX5571174.1 FadR/GntR family transcriptional regulator [Kaistia nematophila]
MQPDRVNGGGLVGDAIGAITRHIRENDLMPGDKLPSEATLSKELNVSRTVVREAFRSLAAMRIIELATGKRATISPIDHGAMSLIIEHGVHTDQINVQQIYDVRRTIETRIVTLASIRRSDAEAAEILAEAAAMRASIHDPDQLMEHDLAFHRALARASKNPVFALIVGAFQGIARQTWPIGWKSRTSQEARDAMIATHEEIARAVAAGDPQKAVSAMAVHFDESVRALLSAGLS